MSGVIERPRRYQCQRCGRVYLKLPELGDCEDGCLAAQSVVELPAPVAILLEPVMREGFRYLVGRFVGKKIPDRSGN